MTIKESYIKRYESGDTPWDIDKPDFNLVEVVSQGLVPRCKALDVGCGTGDNTIWLAEKGFQVTGTDTSEEALASARQKARAAGVECYFLLLDFFSSQIEAAPFDFVFDRGCFHSFDSADERTRFARKVDAHLVEAGLWLTIAGNADEKRQRPGPPQRTAADIVLAVEPCFEILSLRSTVFGSKSQSPPRAWTCLTRKRPFE